MAPATLIPAFFDLWDAAATRGNVALVDADSELTYYELRVQVGRMAGGLREAGVKRDDRVAIAVERTASAVVVILAVLMAGACPCVMEPRLAPEEVRRRAAMAKLSWLLFDPANAEASNAYDPLATRCLETAGLRAADDYWALDTAPTSPALLLFTSGSSGKPKGVLQSHAGLLTNARGIVNHTMLTSHDRLLHVMPLHHTNGVNNQILAPLLAGSSIVMAGRFKAADMPELMERYQPTIVTGVPTMYSRMLPETFSSKALRSLRMLRCGSAPITEALHRAVERKFGTPLVVSYGLSEATCTSTMNPPGRRKIGSVGTVLAGQQVQLRDSDGNLICGANHEGEVCISGDSLMLGYLEETAEGEPVPVGNTLRTGDLGSFDDDGYLYITGRIKDVIIRGGENLSPLLIESVLVEVPGVKACCVVGKRDADLGEVPWSFVVRSVVDGGVLVDDARLKEAVKDRLSHIYQPAGYSYFESLPENSVGKVDRKALAAVLNSPP
jgi:acyl-CoA synthetase (AMP-forming)/AMP-acid ligase II